MCGRNASSASARKNDSSPICEACAAIAARLRSMTLETSTIVVMRDVVHADVDVVDIGRLGLSGAARRPGRGARFRKC